MNKELLTEIEFEDCGFYLTITCPDEDSEISIIVGGSHIINKVNYSLTIEEAKKVRDFLINHIDNYEQSNSTIPKQS